MRINRKICAISVRFFAVHYRKRKNAFHGVCRPTGKVITLFNFAASKKHIGLYPGPAAVEEFAEALKGYKTDKGTIRIPYGKVDVELIKRIALWCYETGNHA